MSLDRNISGFSRPAPIMLRMSYVCYDRLGPAAIIPVLEILQVLHMGGKRQQYLKGHRKAIHSLLW